MAVGNLIEEIFLAHRDFRLHASMQAQTWVWQVFRLVLFEFERRFAE